MIPVQLCVCNLKSNKNIKNVDCTQEFLGRNNTFAISRKDLFQTDKNFNDGISFIYKKIGEG